MARRPIMQSQMLGFRIGARALVTVKTLFPLGLRSFLRERLAEPFRQVCRGHDAGSQKVYADKYSVATRRLTPDQSAESSPASKQWSCKDVASWLWNDLLASNPFGNYGVLVPWPEEDDDQPGAPTVGTRI